MLTRGLGILLLDGYGHRFSTQVQMAVSSKPGTPYKVGNRDSPAGPATTVPSVKQPFYDLHASPHSRAECQLGEYNTIWSNLKSLLILFFSNQGIS